jgi:hypothetical protein
MVTGASAPDLLGCEGMSNKTVLEKMKYLVFAFLGAMVIYLIYVNYMIRTHPYYFFGL